MLALQDCRGNADGLTPLHLLNECICCISNKFQQTNRRGQCTKSEQEHYQ